MSNKKTDCKAADLKTQKHNNTKSMVLSMLTTKPQNRYMLAGAVGISEREFRRVIHDLRNDGILVIAEPTGGYRLGTKAESKWYINGLYSRAYDLLRTAKKMEGANPDQITFEEYKELVRDENVVR